MKIDITEITQRMKTKAAALITDKKPLLIMLVGILGIILVLLSETGDRTDKKENDTESTDSAAYVDELTLSLTELVSQIDGVGRAKVMLTMDRYKEDVFAVDSNEKTEKQNNGEINSNNEYEYIIIKGSGSQETGLVRLTLEPKVRGVCVVCDGGDNVLVRDSVIRSISAVLGIGTDCVSVTKMTEK